MPERVCTADKPYDPTMGFVSYQDMKNELEGCRVLDVCCGLGDHVQELIEAGGSSAVGVDIAMEPLKTASKNANGLRSVVSFLQGDAYRLPFRSGAFDAVVCTSTLHVLDQPRALAEMARVTKPDGKLILPDIGFWYVVRRLFSRFQPATSSRLRSMAGLLLLGLNGFLYTRFGIRPLFRRFTGNCWFSYIAPGRLAKDLQRHSFQIVRSDIRVKWAGLPVVYRWIARRTTTAPAAR